MDLNQWLLFAFLAKFGVLIGTFWLVGLCLVRLVFGVHVSLRLRCVLWCLTALSSLAIFALTAGILMDSIAGMTDRVILGFIWETPVGTALALRVIGLGLVAISLLPIGRIWDWIGVIGSIALLTSFVVSGHVSGLNSVWVSGLLAFHIAIAAFWVGILFPLHTLALNDPKDAARVGQKFGQFAIVLVPLMVIAGGAMAWQLMGSINALLTTGYGNLLMIKVAGVGVLMLGAALNKLRFIPALLEDDKTAADGLAQTIEMEGAAVIFILAFTAALTSFGGP